MVKFIYYGINKQLQAFCVKTSHKKLVKNLGNQLRTIAINKRSASMSALQLGQFVRFFVLLNKQYLKPGQWINYPKLRPANYRAFLNSQVLDHSLQTELAWQESASYPGIKMLIERPKSIKIEYMNESLDFMSGQFHNFQARIIQHQIDHNFGFDYLKFSQEIELTDQKLKQKHGKQCKQLYKMYRNSMVDLQKQIKQEAKYLERVKNRQMIPCTDQFNKLKQFITYSIIDKMKQD